MASWNVFRGTRLRELDKKQSVSAALPGLSFRLDEAQMRQLSAAFANFPGAIRQAMLLATDRTRQFTRNELVRSFKALLTLKPAYIGKGIKSRKAKLIGDGAEAEIRIATGNIPLGRYGITPETPPNLKGVPVRARKRVSYALRIGGMTYDDRSRDAGASPESSRLFVMRTSTGHIGVFYRTDRGRKGKVRQEYSYSLQYHAKADGFLERINDLSVARFREDFVSEAGKITGISA